MSDKSLLRKKFISLRESIETEYRCNCDKVIADKLFSTEDYLLTKEIFVYVSAKNEVDTVLIIERAFSDGKKVAVPHCNGGKMNFYYITSLSDLTCVQFGIPTVDVSKVKIAVPLSRPLCIVPALSFDINGNRLGYGGGYYDRFLADNDVNAIGLCREISIAESLPAEDFDVKIDCIITDKRIIKRRVKSGE